MGAGSLLSRARRLLESVPTCRTCGGVARLEILLPHEVSRGATCDRCRQEPRIVRIVDGSIENVPNDDRTRIAVLPSQLEVLSYPGKMAAMRGGKGAGKSVTSALYALRRMLPFPKGQHFIVGADYPQLKRGFLVSFRALLDRLAIRYDYRATDGTFILPDYAATLACLSSELDLRINSLEPDTIILEEPQSWEGDALEVYRTIVSRLRGSPPGQTAYTDLQPQLRMSFNPPPAGSWLYDVVERDWNAQGYPCWQLSVRDNVLMGEPRRTEYVELLQLTYPEDRWPSEIDGEWSTIGGNVYRGFDVSIHGVVPDGLPPLALDPRKPLQFMLDFNVEWACSVICQSHVQRDVLVASEQRPGFGEARNFYGPEVPGWQKIIVYALDEITLHDAGTPDVVEEFLRRYGDQAREYGVTLYGDASGNARAQTISSQNAARTNWDIVKHLLNRAGVPWTLRMEPSNPSVDDRVNAVRLQFKDSNGYGFLVDADRCPFLVRDFRVVKHKVGSSEIDKTDKSEAGLQLTHASDALGYMIWIERCLANRRPLPRADFFGR